MKYRQRVLRLIAIVVMIFMTKASFGAIPPTERTALIALYNSTGGDGWTDNAGWKDGVLEADGFGPIGSEGNWKGVWVVFDQVFQLYLKSNQLTGSIPPELGDLASLAYCILENNQLTGSIPPELGDLANLSRLNLRRNQLTGSIPPELGDLVNLKDCFVENNQLTGIMPPELGNLVNLYRLELNGNQLIGRIPAEIGNLVNLKVLRLNSNQLTGRIPDSLLNLVNLHDGVGLSIASNHLCTDNDAVKAFVDLKAGSGWEDSQTNTGCDLEPIPTLNEWGMIILTGLLILVSSIMVRRNKDQHLFFIN